MPVYVRDAGAWQQFPTVPQDTRHIWVRDAGVWKAAQMLFVRDEDTWKQETEYLGIPAAPTNFRVTSTSTDYNGITFEWDYPGEVSPHHFDLYIYNYGNNIADPPDLEVYGDDGGSRMFRYNSGQNTNVRAHLAAVGTSLAEPAPGATRFFGGGTTNPGETGGVRWKTGTSAYTVYDVPIYGWGNYFEYTPSLNYQTSQYTSGNSGQQSRDNNTGTQWICVGHSQTGTINDWEGCAYNMPTGNYRYVGVRVIQGNGPCWVSHGVYHNGAWRGSVNHSMAVPPVLGGGLMDHNYLSFYTVSMDQYIWEGAYATNVGTGNLVQVTLGSNLTTHPSIGMGYFCSIKEVRLLLEPWAVVDYGPRTVAAVPSGAW